MSLSDTKENGFQPIDLTGLDRFDDEVSKKSEDLKPDLARFTLLFDPLDFPEKDPGSFKALFSSENQPKGEPFEPLIKQVKQIQAPEIESSQKFLDPADKPGKETQPEKQTPDQEYAQGFDQGLAQGEEKGRAAGYDQGYEQGQGQGFKKGESEGYDKGYQEGCEKAQAEIQKQALEILEPLKEVLTKVDPILDQLLDKYEAQILELIFKIAQKVVMASVKMDDESVKHTILDALKSLVAPEKIILNVSSEDYEYIEMIKDDFFEAMESLKHVAVRSDPLIKKGGCKIETATASISTDPEAKLAAVYEALLNAGLP